MRYLIGYALFLPMLAFAQDPPLPKTLLNTKTAFVEKVGSEDKSFDTYCKTPTTNENVTAKEQDKRCKELEKWRRFTLHIYIEPRPVRLRVEEGISKIKNTQNNFLLY